MVIVFGQRLYGRVDQVPGACYVKTRFFHVYYVPLIPISSWVIVEGTESSDGFHGAQIGMSGKSVLFGWLQAFLFLFGLVTSIYGAVQVSEHNKAGKDIFEGVITLIVGILSLVVWIMFLIRPLRAGPDRARELMEELGMKTEVDAEEVDPE